MKRNGMRRIAALIVLSMLCGLAVFTKRAVLCGEDSRAHIYRSDTRLGAFDGRSLLQTNRPTAVVEAVDT